MEEVWGADTKTGKVLQKFEFKDEINFIKMWNESFGY